MVLRWAADNGRGESFLLGGYVRTDFVSIRTFLLFLIPLSSFQGNENPILGFFSSGVQSSKGSRNLSNFFYLSLPSRRRTISLATKRLSEFHDGREIFRYFSRVLFLITIITFDRFSSEII